MKLRKWSSEEKMAIVLEGLRGAKIGSLDLSGASDKPGAVLSVAERVFGGCSEGIKQWEQ